MRRAVRGMALLAVVALLAACASSTDDEEVSRDTAPPATAVATTVAVTAPPVDAPRCTNDNVTESYTPLSPMPRPNQMPPGSTLEAIQKRGQLIVGISADTLQFGARNPLTGHIEGFDIDMLHEVSNAIFGNPDKIEFKVITYAQRIPNLQSKQVDIVAHTMTINCVRWNQIAFSSEYYTASQKLLVGKDPALANVKVLDDLAGKRVCVAAGSTNEQELAKHKQVVAVVVPDLTDCMVKFQRGEVDGVTGDDTVLAGFAKQDPYAVVLPTRITSEPYGLGINKDNIDLVRFVNGVLESVRTSDRWAGYYRKWVGTPAPNPPAARYGRPDAVR